MVEKAGPHGWARWRGTGYRRICAIDALHAILPGAYRSRDRGSKGKSSTFGSTHPSITWPRHRNGLIDVLPADLWRWWLIANAPESADVDFEFRRFAGDVNKDLADVFGNLATRATSFACRAFDGRIPVDGSPGFPEFALASEVERRLDVLRDWHEKLEFRRAAAETRALWV